MSSHSDSKLSELRGLVTEMQLALADAGDQPRAVWDRLVLALDLGPEPEVRACPTCGKLGMRAATRCGYCWSALTPA